MIIPRNSDFPITSTTESTFPCKHYESTLGANRCAIRIRPTPNNETIDDWVNHAAHLR